VENLNKLALLNRLHATCVIFFLFLGKLFTIFSPLFNSTFPYLKIFSLFWCSSFLYLDFLFNLDVSYSIDVSFSILEFSFFIQMTFLYSIFDLVFLCPLFGKCFVKKQLNKNNYQLYTKLSRKASIFYYIFSPFSKSQQQLQHHKPP
jgi:hypothetical protein